MSFDKNCEVPDGNIVTIGLKISIALCSSGGMSTTMRCGGPLVNEVRQRGTHALNCSVVECNGYIESTSGMRKGGCWSKCRS